MNRTSWLVISSWALLTLSVGTPRTYAEPPSPSTTPPSSSTPPAAPAAPKPVQDPSLPAGKDILSKYVAATGGREAWSKITSQKSESTLEAVAQGLKGTIRIEQVKAGESGGKMRMEVDIAAMGVTVTAFDGTTAWSTNPMQGPRVLKGPELAQLRALAYINRELDPDAHYTSVDTVAVEKTGDVDCYKVVVTPKEGKPETRYYDKSTGLLNRTTSTSASEMGEITGDTYYSDYRDVDGVKLPYAATQKVMGVELKLVVSKVTFNEPIADDRFAPPADVKKVLEQSEHSRDAKGG